MPPTYYHSHSPTKIVVMPQTQTLYSNLKIEPPMRINSLTKNTQLRSPTKAALVRHSKPE
jgi:hypothetical protein